MCFVARLRFSSARRRTPRRRRIACVPAYLPFSRRGETPRVAGCPGLRRQIKKKKSLQNPPTPPVSSRIRGINVEIVARRCSSTSEMKYLLLKVEKRCQTTIEKILKSIVDERRSPNLLAARIYARLMLSRVVASDRQLRAAPATGSTRIWCVSHHSSRNAAQWPCEGCPS